MTSRAIPLQDLAHRISQQQGELEKLRREYEARQTHLRDLNSRKEKLQAQLQQVEAEIRGVGQGSALPPTPVKTSPKAAKPAAAAPVKSPTGTVSLPKLLLRIVAKAGGPITVKEVAREVVRHKYPSTSKNLPKMVEKRVSEMVKKGLLRRAPNQLGVLPAQTAKTTPPPAAKVISTPAAAVPKPAPVAKPAITPPTPATENELPLPVVVTQVLAKTSEPISARDLAEKVLATGYKSKSKDFINVIWAGVGKMDNVENVPGKGYRLKKAAAAAPASKPKGSK
jgi:hypothetical protein